MKIKKFIKKCINSWMIEFSWKLCHLYSVMMIIRIMTQVERCHGTDPVNGEPNWVSSLSTLHNSDMVLTGSRDGFIRIWSIGEGFRSIKPVGTIQVSALYSSYVFSVLRIRFILMRVLMLDPSWKKMDSDPDLTEEQQMLFLLTFFMLKLYETR